MATKPAAGPLTPSDELLNRVTIKPPTIPAMTPDIADAPEANAIPKHKGIATRNTTKPDGMSVFQCLASLKIVSGPVFCMELPVLLTNK